ncbi:MAG: serine protease [Bacteroidota bacterium]
MTTRMRFYFLLIVLFSSTHLLQAQRVIGGEAAQDGAYPWMAALVDGNTENLRDAHFCSAVLIEPGWALTAAHCFNNLDDRGIEKVELLLGTNSLEAASGTFTRVAVEQIIRHPNYVAANGFNYDLALLKLSNNAVQETVSLPSASESFLSAAGIPCRVLGWGIRDTNYNYDPLLQQANIEIIHTDDCNRTSRYNGRITSNMLCAGSEGSFAGAAIGDSGGPLLVFYNNQWYAVGIVSWGQEDWTTPLFPGVYQNVSRYYDWIQTVVQTTTAAEVIKKPSSNPLKLSYERGQIKIQNNNPEVPFNSCRIVVADLLGRSLIDRTFRFDDTYSISVADLSDGPFVVSISTPETLLSRIFVKS